MTDSCWYYICPIHIFFSILLHFKVQYVNTQVQPSMVIQQSTQSTPQETAYPSASPASPSVPVGYHQPYAVSNLYPPLYGYAANPCKYCEDPEFSQSYTRDRYTPLNSIAGIASLALIHQTWGLQTKPVPSSNLEKLKSPTLKAFYYRLQFCKQVNFPGYIFNSSGDSQSNQCQMSPCVVCSNLMMS